MCPPALSGKWSKAEPQEDSKSRRAPSTTQYHITVPYHTVPYHTVPYHTTSTVVLYLREQPDRHEPMMTTTIVEAGLAITEAHRLI